MGVTTEPAASGPGEVNAGTPETNADPLNAAIDAAMADPAEVTHAETQVEADNPVSDELQGTDKADGSETEPANKAEGEPQEAVAPSDQAKALNAPDHWPAERRQAFNALPEDARKVTFGFIKDLQAGYTRKMQDVSDQVRFADAVSGLFTQDHYAQMQREGVTVVDAVKNLIDLHEFASRDPAGYVKWAMQRFNVKPEHLFENAQQQAGTKEDESIDDILIDPTVKQLRTELADVKNKLASFSQTEEQRRQQEAQQQRQSHQQALNAVFGTLQQFRSSLDDDGNLKYPHFDALQKPIGALMETHPQLVRMPDGIEKLDKAYQMALRADPELGEAVYDSEVNKRMAAKLKAQEAERAKRAVGARPSAGSPAVTPAVVDLDDAIRQSMSQAGI